MEIVLKCSAFKHDETIPIQFTCQGDNISPPFEWSIPPDNTKSMILIAEDPDAPHGWIHWVLFNIPPHTREIPENCPRTYELKDGSYQGMNDFREIGYGGPCPPSGIHRYYFRIYAVDIILHAHLNMTKEDLMSQIRGHVLATGEYMGRYGKI